MADETVTIETVDGTEVEVPAGSVNAYQRALDTHSGIEHLSKSEAIFYLDKLLTGSIPEDWDGPSDHNGHVTKSQVKEWAAILADYASRNGTDAFETARDNVMPDDSDTGESDGNA